MPSRTPAPVTSSTPTVSNLVLIPHTSTPKPGETASRITLGDNDGVPPLSAIYEVSTPDNRLTSPTPSTITATDMSTEQTPTMATERRQGERAPTMRGQAAAARKKIAAMQIRDDEDENDEEQFQKLFSRRRSTKSKYQALVPVPLTNELSEVSVSALTARRLCLSSSVRSQSHRSLQPWNPSSLRRRRANDLRQTWRLVRTCHVVFPHARISSRTWHTTENAPHGSPKSNRRAINAHPSMMFDDQPRLSVILSLAVSDGHH